MGRLYDGVQAIERAIQARGLNPNETRGLIGMKAGFFLVIVRPETEDDPAKIAALRSAAEEVLGEKLTF